MFRAGVSTGMATKTITWAYPTDRPQLAETIDLCIPWDYMAASGYTYFQPGDPSVVKRGNQWHMYFSSMAIENSKIHILEATLPENMRLQATGWRINPVPIISPGATSGDWNFSATETPCYVLGYVSGQPVERIYYTGWTYPTGTVNNYALSYAQWNGSGWTNYNTRMFEPATIEYSPVYGSMVGDQSVVWKDGYWHLYYQSVTPSGTTIITLYRNSVDGSTWSAPQQVNFAPSGASPVLPNGPYHLDVSLFKGKYMLSGWLPKTDLTKQGIYLTTSENPLAVDDHDYKSWVPVLYEGSGADWFTVDNAEGLQSNHTIGLFGSDIVKDENKTWLFFAVVTKRPIGIITNIGACELAEKKTSGRICVATGGKRYQFKDV